MLKMTLKFKQSFKAYSQDQAIYSNHRSRSRILSRTQSYAQNKGPRDRIDLSATARYA